MSRLYIHANTEVTQNSHAHHTNHHTHTLSHLKDTHVFEKGTAVFLKVQSIRALAVMLTR